MSRARQRRHAARWGRYANHYAFTTRHHVFVGGWSLWNVLQGPHYRTFGYVRNQGMHRGDQ